MHGLETIKWMNRPENVDHFLRPACPWPHPGGVVMAFSHPATEGALAEVKQPVSTGKTSESIAV